MIKKILFLTIINCAALSAQLNFSITGGLNYSKFNSILWGRDYYNLFNKFLKFQAFPNLGLEISYTKNRFVYLTGFSYSYRGGRDYSVPKGLFREGYAFDIDGYIEIPLGLSYSYFNNKVYSGLGFVLHERLYNGSGYYDERNKIYGLDARISSTWNINRYLAISPSYTLGNLDKYIANTYGNFMHHVFALNLKYTFLHFDKNSTNNNKVVKKNKR